MTGRATPPEQLPPGVILAGGEGRRLGMGAKPLVGLAGQPVITHVIAALKSQTCSLALSVRDTQVWANDLGLSIVVDAKNATGPLAGIAMAMTWAREKYPEATALLTCPADSPFIPKDLVARLAAVMDEETDIAVAASGGQRHHLTALWNLRIADDIAAALSSPDAVAIHRFQMRHRIHEVSWATTPFDPFFNINTADDLTKAQRIWSTAHTANGTDQR